MKKKDYAVYVRVSTDKDEQISSVENQIDICRNWLERNGYEWDESCVYKDEGISGTVFLDRPAIQMILEKAKRKEIKMVIFKSISRLARDLKDSLEIRETLIAHGVRIISVEEGYDSDKAGKNDIAFELWSLFAAQYSRTLSAGVSAALAAKVRRGEHIGKIPYGYDRIDGKLVIKEDEAKVVRQIFEWYNQGWGYKRITKELNARGISSKTGQRWQMTSIQRIIQNPIYCGDFILNQYTTVKVGGRKKQIRNPRDKWIIFRDHHPAIVPREVWEQANNKQVVGAKRRITPWNEFRGIMKCSVCGSNMVVNSSWKRLKDGTRRYWNYLECSQYRRAGYDGCVKHAPILYDDIRATVIERLIEKGREISLDFTTDFERQRAEELAQLQKQASQLETKKKSLVDLYLDGLINKDEFEAKRKELDHEIHALEQRIIKLQNQASVEADIRTIQQAFAALENQDQDLYPVFRTLIREILVHPDGTIDIEYTFRQPVATMRPLQVV